MFPEYKEEGVCRVTNMEGKTITTRCGCMVFTCTVYCMLIELDMWNVGWVNYTHVAVELHMCSRPDSQVAMSEHYLTMRSNVILSNDHSAFLCLLVRVDACVCMYMYTCMCGTESAHWCECVCVHVHVHVPFGQKMPFVCMYM